MGDMTESNEREYVGMSEWESCSCMTDGNIDARD